jgi:two-component system, OmpR family, response regulator
MRDDAVLIVDDDPDLRDLVRVVVESAEIDVVEASTCREAMAALHANRDRIRLVLLDYFMPGMDPAACTRELCRLAGPTLVVLCTAAADPALRAAEVGLSRWLPKPFEIEALERLVREAAPASVR